MRLRINPLLVLLALASTPGLRADATLFVEEPYGSFGAMNPTGHAAIYLSRVCAATPTFLRRCEEGELGAVISRYSRIAQRDWIAIPLIPYLYAVEQPGDVPIEADSETVALLRDEYRRQHLEDLVPSSPEGQTPGGRWGELIGAAYNRRIYGFRIETTGTQDNRLIYELNSRKNRSRFNLFFNNCADFSRGILNLYYSGSTRRSIIADAGITTPKQLAKSLLNYAKEHPELHISAFFLPQVPGPWRRSHEVRSVCEALVKSKKYILPLGVFHPWVAVGLVAAYVAGGHFKLAHYAETQYVPNDLPLCLTQSAGHPGIQ